MKNHNFKKSLNKIKFIDLFCGIGGFRMALESFGAQCVFSSDFEARQLQGSFFNEVSDV